MNKTALLIIAFSLLWSCAQPDKREELTKLKIEFENIQFKISELERELALDDPNFIANGNMVRKKLVVTDSVQKGIMTHYIEFTGNVEAKTQANISAEIPSPILQVHVRDGQLVSGGQTLFTLDSRDIQNSINELQTHWDLANVLYDKRKRLWEQNIGSEVQYLQSKTEKESIEKRMESMQTMLSKTRVRAPFSGVVEKVIAEQGELAGPGVPLAVLVNMNQMKIVADVAESYLGKVKRGDNVVVTFPSLNQSRNVRVSNIGQILNPNNRTFAVEISLPNRDKTLKPNLTGIVKIKDYESESTIIVPTKYILEEGDGSYIMILSETEDGMKADKIKIETGVSYEDRTEILSGLSQTDRIITDGFRTVGDGEAIRLN